MRRSSPAGYSVAAVLVLAATSGNANTITVDCSGGADAVTIQAGVDAASNGDTLLIAPCTYTEHVVVSGKRVFFIGAGRTSTFITWSGSEPTLDFADSPVIENLTVVKEPASSLAVRWDELALTVRYCAVIGRATGGTFRGYVNITGSNLTYLAVLGGSTRCTISDSYFGSAIFGSIFEDAVMVRSSNSSYDVLRLGALAGGTSQDDRIGTIHLSGALYNSLSAAATTIDSCTVESPAPLSLTDCKLGSLRYDTQPYSTDEPSLQMHGCLVTGDLRVGPDPEAGNPAGTSAVAAGGTDLEHNTIVGDLVLDLSGLSDAPTKVIRDNIVGGDAVVQSPWVVFFDHNLIAGALTPGAPGIFGANLTGVDPRFCDPAIGNYWLEAASPALGAAHDHTDMGAFGLGCETVSVQRTTWGRLKARFP